MIASVKNIFHDKLIIVLATVPPELIFNSKSQIFGPPICQPTDNVVKKLEAKAASYN